MTHGKGSPIGKKRVVRKTRRGTPGLPGKPVPFNGRSPRTKKLRRRSR